MIVTKQLRKNNTSIVNLHHLIINNVLETLVGKKSQIHEKQNVKSGYGPLLCYE